jgi:hypothetical protein
MEAVKASRIAVARWVKDKAHTETELLSTCTAAAHRFRV